MSPKQMLVSIVIPVYNEELTVGNVIERVQTATAQMGLNNEIIVVDDHSFDKSLQVARTYPVRVYSLKSHVGKGMGLRAGFAKAKGDIIVTIDSDGSHRPEELSRVLTPILKNKTDLVIGSRYLNQKDVEARKLNAFGVKLFNLLIQMFIGVFVTDSQSGYRAMKRDILKKLHLKSGGYEIESEMLVKIAKGNYRVLEVPISFEQRTYGRSGVDPLRDGFRILLSIVSARLRGL
jgi:glycosyltransferase involved in cell wall biosynthesis